MGGNEGDPGLPGTPASRLIIKRQRGSHRVLGRADGLISSSHFMTGKKSAPACWPASPSTLGFSRTIFEKTGATRRHNE